MEVIGKVKLIKATETVGANGFQKRDIIVTTDEQYPQYISIQFVQDKCSVLDSYQVGQNVKVSINLRGKEWINPQGEAVYFNTIQGWRIEALSDSVDNSNNANQQHQEMAQQQQQEAEASNEPDDLPF